MKTSDISIVYGDNVNGATRMFHDAIVAFVNNGTPLPEECADLFDVKVLVGFNADGSNRGIVNWA